MTTNDNETGTDGAAEAIPPSAPPEAPAAAEDKAPGPGEPGFTHGDQPKQVAPKGFNAEAELAKKRAAAPAEGDEKVAHEVWAKHFGMLPVMLEEPVIKWKTAKAIPGRVNPKFDDYNRAKAHANWAPGQEVSRAEFEAAVADSAAHVFGSPAAARPTTTSK